MVGALLTALVDINIPNLRLRVSILGIAAVGGAIMTMLGRIGDGPWWFEEIEVFLVVFITGLLAAYSPGIAALGLLLTITFVVSLSSGGNPTTALSAGSGYLLGGAILMLFALGSAWLHLQKHPHTNEAPLESPSQPPTPQLGLTLPLLYYTLLRAVGAAAAVAISWYFGGPIPIGQPSP